MTITKLNQQGLAVNDGIIRIYSVNPLTQEYIGAVDEFLYAGVGIPAYSYLDVPLDPKAGYAICRVNDRWQYKADHRGQIAYSTKTGQPKTISELGELSDSMTFKPPKTEFDCWNGSEWLTDIKASHEANILVMLAEKMALSEHAESQIALLGRATKLNIASDTECQQLAVWERYSVLLARIDVTVAGEIHWPTLPASFNQS